MPTRSLRLFPSILKVFSLAALLLPASNLAAEVFYNNAVQGHVNVPFIINIPQKEYQGLLEALPEATIAIDKEYVTERLVEDLKLQGVVPATGRSLEHIGEDLYVTTVLPVLAPRIKEFNDQMNAYLTEDTVGTGIIAFTGVAKSMATSSSSYPAIRIYGIYQYHDDRFHEGGHWELPNEEKIGGQTSFSHEASASLNEDIRIDLQPYGKKGSLTLNFSCKGRVSLTQTYDFAYLGKESPQGKPVASIRLRPSATVLAEKNISHDLSFSITGASNYELRKTFLHPAIHEIEIRAKLPTSD